MTDKNTNSAGSVSISIARQPVFNTKKDLWGYELVCVCDAGEIGSTVAIEDNVAVNVASSNYIGIQQVVDKGKKIIVNFNEKIRVLPHKLPPLRLLDDGQEVLGNHLSGSIHYLLAVVSVGICGRHDGIVHLRNILASKFNLLLFKTPEY